MVQPASFTEGPQDGNTEICGWCNKPYEEHEQVCLACGKGYRDHELNEDRAGVYRSCDAFGDEHFDGDDEPTSFLCIGVTDKYGERREFTPEQVDDRSPSEARAETMGEA